MRLVAAAQASGLAGPGARRPRGGPPLLRGGRRGSHHARLVVGERRPRGGAGPHRHRPRHRLPACARPGHPARHRHLHEPRGPERAARQGPPGARAGARARRRHLRQDRHAHARASRSSRPSRRARASTRHELLALAAAVEADSEHPLARAVVRAAEARGLRAACGRGLRGARRSRCPGLGRWPDGRGRRARACWPTSGSRPRRRWRPRAEAWAAEGRTVLHVIADDRVMGVIALEDEVRPESAEAVERLHAARAFGWP